MDDDELVAVDLTTGTSDVLLFGSTGKAIRFHEKEVREMGRTARGVRGISLKSRTRCDLDDHGGGRRVRIRTCRYFKGVWKTHAIG